ncbi:CUB and sushi domain-containing protein 2-like isoform X4 [Sycon ciliatum]
MDDLSNVPLGSERHRVLTLGLGVLASVAASGVPLLPSASTSPPFYLALLRSYATVPVSVGPVSCHAVLQCRVYPCKNCTALTAPFNGKVTGTGFTPGTGLFFACNAPYVLQGSAVRYCNVSGTWSGVPATCSIPDIPCKYHEFKCGGSGGCISTTKVCDGVWYDCPDGSD